MSTMQKHGTDIKDFAALFNNMDRLKYWSRRITEKFIVNVNDNNNSS